MEQIKEKYGPGLATAGRWAKVLTDEVVKVSPTSSTSIGSASASTSTTSTTTTTFPSRAAGEGPRDGRFRRAIEGQEGRGEGARRCLGW